MSIIYLKFKHNLFNVHNTQQTNKNNHLVICTLKKKRKEEFKIMYFGLEAYNYPVRPNTNFEL